MNSILSFPTDLLFGQMAYADGMPQSSDSASSTTENQQPRARFNLPSQFPAHSTRSLPARTVLLNAKDGQSP